MRRQLITACAAFLVVGFILGFFGARMTHPSRTDLSAERSMDGLPENHPSPESMEKLNALMKRVEENPGDRMSLVRVGNSFYDMGRFDAAIQWYEKAAELDPSDINVLTDLGTSYLYTGHPDTALIWFGKALEIDPTHPQTLQNLGVAHFSTGQYEKSIEVWQKLVDTNPDYKRAAEIREQIETAKLHLKQRVSP